jgi:hypothetical protein
MAQAAPDPFGPEPEVSAELPPPIVEQYQRSERFTPAKGSDAVRLGAIEDFLVAASTDLSILWAAYQNQERTRAFASEQIEYRCLGLKSTGGVCGEVIRAKRPEARSYAERIVCPHRDEWHGGEEGGPFEPIGL